MSFAASIKQSLETPEAPPIAGEWRPISLCIDDTACEFLNVGVVFTDGSLVEVRMLDSFDRIKCLYDTRVDQRQLQYLLMDIEATLSATKGDIPDSLSDTIRLGQPLHAQGEDPESIIDSFFEDVVTLARPRSKKAVSRFRYQSSVKLRNTMVHLLTERLGVHADKIIQNDPFRLRLKNNRTIDIDVPLLSDTGVGSIVSAWYKSPVVVENSILQAGADLMMVASHSDRKPIMSVLIPSSESGLNPQERAQIEKATYAKTERFERVGVKILKDNSTQGLTEQTVEWWAQHGAA